MYKSDFLTDLLTNELNEDVLLAIYNAYADTHFYEPIFTEPSDIFYGQSFEEGFNALADPGAFSLDASYFYSTSYGIECSDTILEAIDELSDISELVDFLTHYGDNNGYLKEFGDMIVEEFSNWAIKSLKNDNPNEVDFYLLKESYLDYLDYDNILTTDWEYLLEEQIEMYLEDQEEENE